MWNFTMGLLLEKTDSRFERKVEATRIREAHNLFTSETHNLFTGETHNFFTRRIGSFGLRDVIKTKNATVEFMLPTLLDCDGSTDWITKFDEREPLR
mmetsp:Transcript_50948/g.69375  ORF Transcript_50948/g.69375 Transcript_50948/m.69375 type:complete len:97 (-) Transcript_50948:364-654(-)